MLSGKTTVPGDENGEFPGCAGCGRKRGGHNGLTWQMSRQDITFDDVRDVKNWIEQQQGQPSALVMPDDGEVLAYTFSPYCDDCLDRFSKEYEERHTPAGKENRAAFQEQIEEFSYGAGWDSYTLQLQYLAPRRFPNMALIRGDQLVLRSVRGEVTGRMRAFHPPAHTLVLSPEVPQDIQEALLRNQDEEQLSDKIAFLYMDEKYPDVKAPPSMQVTSLVGILISSDQFISGSGTNFSGLFQASVKGPTISRWRSTLATFFQGGPDEEHFQFYSGLVSLINGHKCSVYRRGFNFVPAHELLRKKQGDLLGICFRSMLLTVDDFEYFGQIWTVMESDRSMRQDENFAGYMRWMDQATSYLNWIGDGVEELIEEDYMVDNSRFGDLHYVNKKSIGGIAADCLAYLLHCKWLVDKDFPTTEYKARLAAIASTLRPSIVDDYVGSFRLEN